MRKALLIALFCVILALAVAQESQEKSKETTRETAREESKPAKASEEKAPVKSKETAKTEEKPAESEKSEPVKKKETVKTVKKTVKTEEKPAESEKPEPVKSKAEKKPAKATKPAKEEEEEEKPAKEEKVSGSEYPTTAFDIYILGAHWNPVDIKAQMIVHHFCNEVDKKSGLIQCALYDGNSTDSKLIGVEYVVSKDTMKNLPIEERKLWHSHAFEVRSGLLTVPEMQGGEEELEFLSNFANSYGKIINTWGMAPYDVPLGVPSIDMSFTADGQVDPKLAKEVDDIVGTTAGDRALERKDIEIEPILPGIDFWQSGTAVQLGGLYVQVPSDVNTTLPDYVPEDAELDPEDAQKLEPKSPVPFPPMTSKGEPAKPISRQGRGPQRPDQRDQLDQRRDSREDPRLGGYEEPGRFPQQRFPQQEYPQMGGYPGMGYPQAGPQMGGYPGMYPGMPIRVMRGRGRDRRLL